jgi:hypothetical protein
MESKILKRKFPCVQHRISLVFLRIPSKLRKATPHDTRMPALHRDDTIMNLVLQLLLLPLVSSLPQTITVNHNSKECLYDRLEEGEKVTLSIFILSGAELKGARRASFSPDNITSGLDLQAVIDHHYHRKTTGRGFQKIEEDVNFERILSEGAENEAYNNEDDDEGDGEDDDENLWKQNGR